jgi:hypothetical protein
MWGCGGREDRNVGLRWFLASAVRCRLGVRICHLNCGDSADPGTSCVYLEAASLQVSALQRNRSRSESSWPDRHESPHTAPRPRFAGHFAGQSLVVLEDVRLWGNLSGGLGVPALAVP